MDEPTTKNLPAQAASGGLTLADMWRGMKELALNPEVDPDKMRSLLDLQRDMMKDMREQDFAHAMAAARAEMPIIKKDGRITNHKTGEVQSRYANFEAIDKIVRPIAAAHNLSYGFNTQAGADGRLMVSCLVTHTGTHGAIEKEFGPMPLAIDTTGAKNATQGAGSATSYGKRYTLTAAFNIITEGQDDDGTGRGANADVGQSEIFEAVLDGARRAALNGSSAYAAHFASLTNMQKGWLIDNGHHEELKKAAQNHD